MHVKKNLQARRPPLSRRNILFNPAATAWAGTVAGGSGLNN
jgi:hypothetical protein